MQKKPNLLFVFADQLRYQSIGFAGEKQVHTPNIDRFVRESANFVNAISNTPVCTPYRGCMLTGRYPHACGTITNFVRLPDTEKTFGEILKAEGYNTGYIGKWHLSGARGIDYEPPGAGRHGFDYWSSFAFFHRHNRIHYFEDGPEPIEPEGYQTDDETDRAIKFIERQNDEKPFCLFVSWGPPHPPYELWNMPPKYLERYGKLEEIPRSELDEKTAPLWTDWQKPFRFTPAKFNYRKNASGSPFTDKAIATYYAMTDWVDDCFGRILAVLKKKGIEDNTIVVFSSDHGEMLNSHGMAGKMIFYDESVRIPFIVRYPKTIKAGTESDVCISSVDFLPTLLGLMNIDIPDNVQGKDLSNCALGRKGNEPAGAIIASYTGYEGYIPGWEYRGIRTKRYTYARSLQELWKKSAPEKNRIYGNNPEYFLFDNQNDPFQQKNIADDPAYKNVRDELESELVKYLKETGDSFKRADEYAQFFDEKGRVIKPVD